MEARVRLIALTLVLTFFGSLVAFAEPTSKNIFDQRPELKCSEKRQVGCEANFPKHIGTNEALSEFVNLSTGFDSLNFKLNAIKNATTSIRLEVFIFKGDEVGWRMADLLAQKKAEGLDVRVIVDGVSNAVPGWHTGKLYKFLEAHGIETLDWDIQFDEDVVSVNRRNHEKILIVDGETDYAIGVTGGINFANEYYRISNAPANLWRDQDIAARGPIVKDMVTAFEKNFAYHKKRRSLEGRPVYTLENIPKRNELDAELVKVASDIENAQFEFQWHPARSQFLWSRPTKGETTIYQSYIDLIKLAQKDILLVNAYFIPEKEMRKALKEAAKRGVRVRILTNSQETNDIAPISTAGRFFYKELLDLNLDSRTKKTGGSVEILEWHGEKFGEMMMHSKFGVFDQEVAIVGSYNIDPRSRKFNSEDAILFENRELAEDLIAYVDINDIAKSEPITPDLAKKFHKAEDLWGWIKLLPTLLIKGLL